MIAKINTFFRLSTQRKLLIIQAFGLTVYTHFLFSFFNRKARFGKEENIKSSPNKSDSTRKADEQKIKDISWAIQLVNKNIPWKNVCRHQAYQAMQLCNLYKIPCQTFIGFKKNKEKNEIQAHAWTVASGRILTGFCNPEEYTVQNIYNNKWH